ncbi:MAG: GNAT family N-acetyltransferase [Saprospiraceae bacterium]
MISTKVYDENNKPSSSVKNDIVNFLAMHLEKYGDPKYQIHKALDYSVKDHASFGGFTLTMVQDDAIVGSAVINKTGMGGYIPENILFYIATHVDHRGKGIGKQLMQQVIKNCDGDIASHVEKNNPAIHLYERLGFTNPYLEMRLKRQ